MQLRKNTQDHTRGLEMPLSQVRLGMGLNISHLSPFRWRDNVDTVDYVISEETAVVVFEPIRKISRTHFAIYCTVFQQPYIFRPEHF